MPEIDYLYKDDCKHENFVTHAKVIRLTDSDDDQTVTGYRAEIEIICNDCKKPFKFIGLHPGYHINGPTTNLDQNELRIPIEPI